MRTKPVSIPGLGRIDRIFTFPQTLQHGSMFLRLAIHVLSDLKGAFHALDVSVAWCCLTEGICQRNSFHPPNFFMLTLKKEFSLMVIFHKKSSLVLILVRGAFFHLSPLTL